MRMRGLVIGGLALVVVGVLLFVGGYALISSGTSESVAGGQVLALTPSTVGSSTLSVSWSSAPSSGTVYLVTGTPTCSHPSGVVAQANGSSGSFSVTVQPGTTYSLYDCSGGSGAGATFTYSSLGLTYLMVIGIVLGVVGLVLLVLGGRRGPTIEAEPAEAGSE